MTPYSSSRFSGEGSTAEALRAAMDRAGVTKTELSRMTGIDMSTISRMCAGDRVGMLDTWMRARDALGCSMDELVGTRSREAW